MTARLIAAAVIFVVLAIGAFWLVRSIQNSVLIKLERQNNAAGDASDQARSDYDRCRDDGGVYDFGALKCKRPAPRGRN